MSSETRKELIRIAAVLMAYLIILLPMESSMAFGAITLTKIEGNSKTKGYMKQGDTLHIQALISTPGADSNDVKLNKINKFASCNAILGTSTLCDYFSTLKDALTGYYNFEVSYFSEMVKDKIMIDSISPAINLFNVTQTGGKLIARYSIIEEACKTTGCTNKCSGIKDITITINGKTSYYENVAGVPDQSCSNDAESELNITGITGSTKKDIKIVVYDNAGNMGNNSIETMIDLEPTKVSNPALMRSKGGKLILLEVISTKPYPGAFIMAKFTDENIDIKQIFANISSFVDSNNKDYLKRAAMARPLRCDNVTTEKNTVKCIWQAGIRVSKPKDLVIIFWGYDKYSNYFSQTYTPLLPFDDSDPLVKSIHTDRVGDKGSYINKHGENRLIVEVEESGSGMNNSQVYLDLADINPNIYSGTVTQVDSCNGTSNIGSTTANLWRCYKKLEVSPSIGAGDRANVQIVGTSEDDTGNALIGTLSSSFIYDDEIPVVESMTKPIECASVGYPTGELGQYNIEVNLSDQLAESITGYFNISSIVPSTTMQMTTAQCTETDTINHKWSCKIPIPTQGLITDHKIADLPGVFYDTAGNPLNFTVTNFEVCNSSSDMPPNIYSVTVTDVFPSEVDRLAAKGPSRPIVMLQLDIRNMGDPQNAVFRKYLTTNCRESIYVDSADMIADYTDTPIIRARLNLENVADKASFDLVCNLSMRIRVGDSVYDKPQITEIRKTIPITDLAAGYAVSNVDLKINESKEKIRQLVEDTVGLRILDTSMHVLCLVGNAILYLNAVAQASKVGIAIGAMLMCIFPATYAAASSFWFGSCKMLDGLLGFAYSIIWKPACISTGVPPIPSCTVAPTFPQVFKLACMIYNCQLCGHNTFFSTIISVATEGKSHFYANSMDTKIIDAWRASDNKDAQPFRDLILDWDPYKNKWVGEGCACLPSQIFAFEKERQVLCKRIKCLQSSIEKGYPSSWCEEVYQEDMCLYVTGASWQIGGKSWAKYFFNGFGIFAMAKIFTGLMSQGIFNIPPCKGFYYPTPVSWGSRCTDSCPAMINMWSSVMCGLLMSMVQLLENQDMAASPFDFGGEQYQSWKDKVESEGNYCKGIPEIAGEPK